jgi:hypothetical protein
MGEAFITQPRRVIGRPFLPGNVAARGRSRKRASLAETFRACATVADQRAVFKVLRDAALAGDMAAVRTYLEYVVGRPDTTIHTPDLAGPSLPDAIQALLAAGANLEAEIKLDAQFLSETPTSRLGELQS